MTTPQFDSKGVDRTTFAPFILRDARDQPWKDVRLEFSDWAWLQKEVGGDSIGGYYLNGPGVQGLVLAARQISGLEPVVNGMDLNSEGDTCYIHFTDFDEAVRTAELSLSMIKDSVKREEAASVAANSGLGDD